MSELILTLQMLSLNECPQVFKERCVFTLTVVLECEQLAWNPLVDAMGASFDSPRGKGYNFERQT